jgi:hypothetical protein
MENLFFCHCDQEGFGMGAEDHYGLFFSECLTKGSTHSCKTYNNDLLTDENHFEIAHLEIWGFN